MSEPKTPASDGESEQVDSPTLNEPEMSENLADRSESPPIKQRAAGKALGVTALIIALCALGLAVWQWSQEAFDVVEDDGQSKIENVVSRLDEHEQSLTAQQQSLQQVHERTSDERLNTLIDRRVDIRLDEGFDDRIDDRIDNRLDDRLDNQLDTRIDSRMDDYLDDRLDNRLEDRIQPITRQVEGLTSELNGTTELVNELQSSVNSLQSALAASERQREALSARIQQVAGEQREADQEMALRLALLEAAAMLRFGQAQAELAGDYASAAVVFRRAQSLIEANADPRLGQARQQLSVELEALESSQGPDWTDAQLRLAGLSDQVEFWPLARSGNEPLAADAQADSGNGWWSGMKNSLGQLVEVERRDLLELNAEQVSALREQLRLRLVAAELAIERRDMESARRHLQNVDERIERHFDMSNADVIEAQAALEEIQSLQPAESPADLGRALASLRQVLEAL